MSTQTTTETPASRSFTSTDIPKSPPKWPLRPGVLVHVKCNDTKQNLCANRAQSPTHNASLNASSINNVSYASPLLNHTNSNARNTSMVGGNDTMKSTATILPELPVRNAKQTSTTNDDSGMERKAKMVARALLQDDNNINDDTKKEPFLGTAIKSPNDNPINGTNHKNNNHNNGNDTTTIGLLIATNSNSESTNNDELLRFTSSNLIERILGRLRWRREQPTTTTTTATTTTNNHNNHNGNSQSGGTKKAKSLLLRSAGWFGSGKSTNSTTGLMNETNKQHLNGISSGE